MIIRLLKFIFGFIERYWKFLVVILLATIPFVWEWLISIAEVYSETVYEYLLIVGTAFFRRMIPYTLTSIVLSFFYYFYWRYFIARDIVSSYIANSIAMIIKHIADMSLVFLVGVIKSGKTSGIKFIIDVVSKYKTSQARKRMEYLKYKTMYVNYSAIDQYIDKNYEVGKVYLQIDRIRFVTQMMAKVRVPYKFRFRPIKLKFDTTEYKLLHILVEYLELYYIANLRGVHVVSNTSMRNNGEMAVIMHDSSNKLKEAPVLPIEKFVCYLRDEAGVTDNSRSRNAHYGGSREQYDDGKEQNLALIRHPDHSTGFTAILGQNVKETSGPIMRYIQMFIKTNIQGKEDFVIYETEIGILDDIQSYLVNRMYKRYDKKMRKAELLENDQSWHSYAFFVSKAWCMRKAAKIHNKWDNYLDKFNNHKKLIVWLMVFKEKLEEYVLCKRPIEIHYQSESLGLDLSKEIPYSAFSINIYYLANEVYGEYAEHQYDFLGDIRNRHAKCSLAVADRWSSPRKAKEEEIRNQGYLDMDEIIDLNKNGYKKEKENTTEKRSTKKPVNKRKTRNDWDLV